MKEEAEKKLIKQIVELKTKLDTLEEQLTIVRLQLEAEREQRSFYQLIADFAYGWELWFEPSGKLKYCSPSCFDLTGYTANQIIAASDISELLVYSEDKLAFGRFLSDALNQALLHQTFEFRILTLSKQLRWCIMYVRSVYDKRGKYLGIRASVQDITRLKTAMGTIRELQKGNYFAEKNKQRLQHELELMDRELVSFLLQLSQKNELISKINALLSIDTQNKESKQREVLEKIRSLISTSPNRSFEWDVVAGQMEKSYPGFLSRLRNKHPKLSDRDVRLCAYIRLGLSSKEIAGLMNITAKSVEIARVRLRKKIHLPARLRLGTYLQEL